MTEQTIRAMTTVRGHWRQLPSGRVWIDSHIRAFGGETIVQARERFSARMHRYSGFCGSCGGTGWVFREPPEDVTRCKLCPTCEGRGRA